jgi:WD40 repeat protein
MKFAALCRWFTLVIAGIVLGTGSARAGEDNTELAQKAQAILKANCHRCHGQDGSVEGGMNFILDREKLVARKKIVPGKADESPLFKRVAAGKMPPPEEQPRPSADELAVLRKWIDLGAPPTQPAIERPVLTEAAVFDLILADLEKLEPRARRFTRYFSLASLVNAGNGPDELQTYRHALSKLLNSLSWHPRITIPKSVDPSGLVLRIDLRDYQWDANLWNRLVTEYPYGILHDTAVAKAVIVATATRLPCVRLDWFVANASRPPLYYDLLQIPSNLTELERQLRVDVALDIQQERVARAGFNGSGISRNNRVLERHDAQNGAYWRTYDFDAVPQNLIERDLLLPDRRNLFAYPLGPGSTENTFQHAAGEVIFNLPNGLQGYVLVNANNVRVDKGVTTIVSDPKRPDRAVEAGISCIHCHARGINRKDDQIRDHVAKNAKSFSKADAGLVRALYVPKGKMRELMDEDAERFRKAVEKTGGKVDSAEVVIAMTLRYEADVDLPMLAAEAGVKPEELLSRLSRSEILAKNLGALKVQGGTVARQVVVQAFGDVVRELRLGSVPQTGATGTGLPDNTGEIDPLEAQSSPANAVAFSPDGRFAAFASADKSVRLWDVEGDRELRRCIGHTASVWAVALSPDGLRVLSGSKDATVRLWDVATGRELRKLDGHDELVTCVAFSPDGRRALSAGYDHEVLLWDLDKGKQVEGFAFHAKYVNAVAFSFDGDRCLVCAERAVHLLDARTGKEIRTFVGHGASVVSAAFTPDGKQILSGGDDKTLRLWDTESGKEVRTFSGHESWVKCVAFSPDGKRVLSGSTDTTVRLWDAESGKELRVFRKHGEPIVSVTFLGKGRQTLSASRDGIVHLWQLNKAPPQPDPAPNPSPEPTDVKGPPRPVAVISVGGTVSGMQLSPDGQWLYYLNLTEAKLARVVTETGKRDRVLKLAEGTDALCLSRNGAWLIATASVQGDKKVSTNVQVIDREKMELRKSFSVAAVPYDIAVTDAGMLLISGGESEWTEITAVDIEKEAVLARWGGVWGRSFLQLHPEQRHIYYSSQGVTPGTLEALVIPGKLDEKPVISRASVSEKIPLGGEFIMSPDGRFLLCKTGTVLQASAKREDDLKYHTSIQPFVAATVDARDKRVFALSRDGSLWQYSYPEFKPLGGKQLPLLPYQAVCDGRQGRLYVAGIDPKSVGERPRARGFGDIHVYELKDILSKDRITQER